MQRASQNPGQPSLLSAGSPTSWATGGRNGNRSFARDLNLDQIVAAVAGDREEHELITEVLYAHLRDAGTVRYRQEVFRDLEDAALFSEVQRFADLMHEVRTHLDQLPRMEYRYHREGWLLDAAATYCDAVQSLASHLTSAQLNSRGLLALREYLASYVAAAGFQELVSDTGQQKDALGRIRYCTRIRGGRVDVSRYQGEDDYSAAVLATFERFKQGAVKDYRVQYRAWPGMNHIQAQITDLVARLFPEEFAALDEYCGRHAAFLDEGVTRADRELQFYLAYLDYIRPLESAGLPFCYPQVSTVSKQTEADGSFDIALASKLAGRRTVVRNSLRLGGAERALVVTGPNQGGKTTFARMFGQLHYLAALGLPVPGQSARLFVPDRIFTHFEKEEDLQNLRGRLEDELVRIHEILAAATSRSVIVLNESFASTSLEDASFLGAEFLGRITGQDQLCLYVTFIDQLAALNPACVSMVAEIDPGNLADRTFRVVRKPADGLAFAAAIAVKYGLTYQRLKERIAG